MTAEEVATYIAAQYLPELSTASRQEQLRHWTAEAFAIVTDRTHWQMLDLTRSREFQADSRWIAAQIGASVDQVNVALSRLLRLRLLEIGPSAKWKNLLGPGPLSEAQFQQRALVRVRELAAEHGLRLRQVNKSAHLKGAC